MRSGADSSTFIVPLETTYAHASQEIAAFIADQLTAQYRHRNKK
jgi:hypothetical protein